MTTLRVTQLAPAGNRWPTNGEYVRRFWLPHLGPLAYLLSQELHRMTAGRLDAQDIDVDVLAAMLGVGGRRTPALIKQLDRLERYDFVVSAGADLVLGVRSFVPGVGEGLRRAWPAEITAGYADYMSGLEADR